MRESVPVARRNILADRRRLAVGVLGVGLAVALILLLQGLWGGWLGLISAYEDGVGAQLYVGEPGTRDLVGESSVVPEAMVKTIRSVPGVDRADPISTRYVILDLHDNKVPVVLVGYVPGQAGGPWNVVDGRAVQADDELVMDRTLADDHGIRLGDQIEVLGRPFRVTGYSTGTRTIMGGGILFTSLDAANELLGTPGKASMILVRTGDPAAVADALRARTRLSVLTADQIVLNDRALFAKTLGGPLDLMILIAFAAGTLIVALTVYSAVVERLREYGIAKAIGAGRGKLFKIVLGQTIALAGLGTTAGFLIYRLASWIIATVLPEFRSELSMRDIGAVVAAAGLMALLAAVAPSRRIGRLDPASVYRG